MRFISCILLIVLTLSVISCKKQDTSVLKELSLKEIIDNTIGTYTTNRICSSGSLISGYTYDTTFNMPLIVNKENDSTLSINGLKLSFEGNLNTKYYYFSQPSSGGGHHALIDSTLTDLIFSYWSGGLGGGSGCSYTGRK